MLKLPHLQTGVKLAPYTTYQIGGPADYFVEVATQSALAEALKQARREQVPYFVLGTGANILIGDKGFRGLVIHNRADGFRFDGDDLIAGSGAVVADLIEASVAKGLSGLEHFAGIPSSVGGAMRQNLHFLSPDRQSTLFIAELVDQAKVLDESSRVQTVDRGFFNFGYDDSVIHHREVIVLEVTFALKPADRTKMRAQIKDNLAWRQAKQPQLDEFASCGSVFKKLEGIGAGRLIDHAGLKGTSVGGAQVSAKHANYLVNTGHATAADVRGLIKLIQDKVQADSGHHLEPEIGFVGEF